MAEIIEEPSALSKIIPISFKINDTDSVTTTRLTTKKQFNTTILIVQILTMFVV